MDDLVFCTLLKADPSSDSCCQLLRALHLVSSAGRLAALRTTCKLDLADIQKLGVTYSRQVSVLLAADRLVAIRINSGQIAGLLRALLAAQQQQQHVVQEEVGQQQPAAPERSAIKPKGGSLQEVVMAGKLPEEGQQQLIQLLDALPGAQNLQRLYIRDLDNHSLWGDRGVALAPPQLPGVQASRTTAARDKEEHSSSAGACGVSGHVSGRGGSSSMEGHSPSSTHGNGGSTSGGTGEQQHTVVSAGAGGAWRSSCSYLDVSQTPSLSKQAPLSELRPLLAVLPRLQKLRLEDICVTDLPQCVALLGSVQDLQLKGHWGAGWAAALGAGGALAGAGGPAGWADQAEASQLLSYMMQLGVAIQNGSLDARALEGVRVLEGVAAITQLQKLSLFKCKPFRATGAHRLRLRMPQSFLNLRQLRSLDIRDSTLHSSVLDLLPELEGLEELDISGSFEDAASVLTNTLPKLTRLTGLAMQYSPISSLPEGMAACSRLRKLDWSYSTADVGLQLDVLWLLTGLESLTFADDTLAALPADITQLTQLTKLVCLARSVLEPPVHLRSLVNLRELRVHSHHPLAMAQVVTTLTQLTSVLMMYGPDQLLPPEVEAFLKARSPPDLEHL